MGNKGSQSASSNSKFSSEQSSPRQEYQQQQMPMNNRNQFIQSTSIPTYQKQVSSIDYNDDEEVKVDMRKQFMQANAQKYDLEKGLSIEVKSMLKHFQLSEKQDKAVPIMVSIKTADKVSSDEKDKESAKEDEGKSSRASIDLVCVIDNSGSMSGSKIENVKQTLVQLLDLMGEDDRISLVLFNSNGTRICRLMKTNQTNRNELLKVIKSISANGGTNINSGMEIAFNVLKHRRTRNPISSVFLLSDGQDSSAQQQVKKSIDTLLPGECFTIHSFGFGSDHDAVLMNSLCSMKDGNFYYVEKNDQVDEFFIDALGGLFSVVAQDIVIDVNLDFLDRHGKFFVNTTVSKTFGEMWGVIKKDNHYQIKINQLFSGVSKDFLFELMVPANSVTSIEDFERNVEIVKATVSAIPIDIEFQTKVVKDAKLVWTLFTSNEKVAEDSEVNENVEFNYLRVQASEAMNLAMKQAEENKFEESEKILSAMIHKFDNSRNNNTERALVLKKDLEECSKNSKPQEYRQQGKFKMMTKMNANIKQTSQAVEATDLYQNSMQREMVRKVQSKKGFFS